MLLPFYGALPQILITKGDALPFFIYSQVSQGLDKNRINPVCIFLSLRPCHLFVWWPYESRLSMSQHKQMRSLSEARVNLSAESNTM